MIWRTCWAGRRCCSPSSLLYQRRTLALIHTYALQAWVLAAAAAWQGWVQSEADLYITAAIGLAAKGVIIPVALDRIAPQAGRAARGRDRARRVPVADAGGGAGGAGADGRAADHALRPGAHPPRTSPPRCRSCCSAC
ncbi:MAG: hypothetical protein WDN49_28015 [Acetobacteraceae bacterium]